MTKNIPRTRPIGRMFGGSFFWCHWFLELIHDPTHSRRASMEKPWTMASLGFGPQISVVRRVACFMAQIHHMQRPLLQKVRTAGARVSVLRSACSEVFGLEPSLERAEPAIAPDPHLGASARRQNLDLPFCSLIHDFIISSLFLLFIVVMMWHPRFAWYWHVLCQYLFPVCFPLIF